MGGMNATHNSGHQHRLDSSGALTLAALVPGLQESKGRNTQSSRFWPAPPGAAVVAWSNAKGWPSTGSDLNETGQILRPVSKPITCHSATGVYGFVLCLQARTIASSGGRNPPGTETHLDHSILKTRRTRAAGKRLLHVLLIPCSVRGRK